MKRNVNETVYLTKLNNGDNQTAIKLTMTTEKVKVILSNKNVLHIECISLMCVSQKKKPLT